MTQHSHRFSSIPRTSPMTGADGSIPSHPIPSLPPLNAHLRHSLNFASSQLLAPLRPIRRLASKFRNHSQRGANTNLQKASAIDLIKGNAVSKEGRFVLLLQLVTVGMGEEGEEGGW